jgi:prevent-host-death family protein
LLVVINLVKNIVMIKVNVFEAKAKLSAYLDRAARGERVVVCRHNTPIAELRAVERERATPRPIGPLPGRPTFDLPASFFDPLPAAELDAWEGGTPADPLSSTEAGVMSPSTRTRTRRASTRRRRAARRRS